MNREIKFRGKLKNEKEWLYGSLIHKSLSYGERYYIESENSELGKDAVDIETVGQYTGIKDRNGVEIWEGDIVREKDFSMGAYLFREQPTHNVKVTYKTNGVIGFVAGFDLTYSLRNGVYENGEVIGNIHDNPELLK